MKFDGFTALVVGSESIHNLRLSDLLRKLLGTNRVFRFLETRHLLDHLSRGTSKPTGIFLDLFSFDAKHSTETIGDVRNRYPSVVFCLYIGNEEQNARWQEFPDSWQSRLGHYFKIFKQPEDTELEPIVRRALYSIFDEASNNIENKPRRLTYTDNINSIPPSIIETSTTKSDKSIFISYSRSDWDSFVESLVTRLRDKGHAIWIDQHLLIGGDNWMDEIGEALDTCKLLILIMSPDALGSKFVKMEYRYFFNHDKTIIPILYRPVQRIPPELSVTQYIDFHQNADKIAFPQLISVINKQLSK